MSEDRGVSPVRPRPNPRPASPENPGKTTYSTLTADKRLHVRSLLARDFQEVLAEMAAEREAATADAHVKAA